MFPISLIFPYYENAGMLREQYDSVRNLPSSYRSCISVICVDDGSPNNPAFPEDLNGANLQIYRIMEDIRWNQDAARNIGVHHADTSWILLTDIDHMVPQQTWAHLFKGKWDSGKTYNFLRVSAPAMTEYKPHPNSWFMTKKLFQRVGYDESFAGYYGTDGDFRNRLKDVAGDPRRIKVPLIRVPRTLIPDASTTTYLRKQPEDHINIKRIFEERKATKDWQPKRLSFAYERIYPR